MSADESHCEYIVDGCIDEGRIISASTESDTAQWLMTVGKKMQREKKSSFQTIFRALPRTTGQKRPHNIPPLRQIVTSDDNFEQQSTPTSLI